MENLNQYIKKSDLEMLPEKECYEVNGGWSFKAAFSFAVALGNFAVGVFNGWRQGGEDDKGFKTDNVYLRNHTA